MCPVFLAALPFAGSTFICKQLEARLLEAGTKRCVLPRKALPNVYFGDVVAYFILFVHFLVHHYRQ